MISNDLQVNTHMISGLQCELELAPGGVRIRDSRSAVGTFVDERNIGDETVLLTVDSAIRIGDLQVRVVRR